MSDHPSLQYAARFTNPLVTIERGEGTIAFTMPPRGYWVELLAFPVFAPALILVIVLSAEQMVSSWSISSSHAGEQVALAITISLLSLLLLVLLEGARRAFARRRTPGGVVIRDGATLTLVASSRRLREEFALSQLRAITIGADGGKSPIRLRNDTGSLRLRFAGHLFRRTTLVGATREELAAIIVELQAFRDEASKREQEAAGRVEAEPG